MIDPGHSRSERHRLVVRQVLLVLALACAPLAGADAAIGADLPRYVPPAGENAAPARLLGTANRGSADESLAIAVIAPDHTGLTLQPQPSLYWNVSRPIDGRVRLTIQDPAAIDPLLEIELPARLQAGLIEMPVRSSAVNLRPGIEYQWSVAVSVGDGSGPELVSSGVIKRLERAGAMTTQAQPGAQDVATLAGRGLWYDAIQALAAQVREAPADPLLNRMWAALLDQVGLADATSQQRAGLSVVQQLVLPTSAAGQLPAQTIRK